MAIESPLSRYVKLERLTDAEIRQLLRDTSRQASRDIRKLLENPNFSNQLESKRLRVVKSQVDLWHKELFDGVEKSTKAGIRRATREAARYQSDFERALVRAGGGDAEALASGYRAASERTANAIIGRGHGRKSLSGRVYHARDLSSDRVVRMVRAGVVQGKSPAAIAKDMERYIKPTVPGGVSYAAQRLARTELNNAFHDAARADLLLSPAAIGAQWHLSGSHPEPDECNEYAEEDKHQLGKGVFPVDKVPDKPHPQCLCYFTPKQKSRAEFIAEMRAKRAAARE